MILVQKYHSIKEIDLEFINNLEELLMEEVLNFDGLIKIHEEAPPSDTFTYFLFFGPTQNAPIGFAQLRLRQIPFLNLIPWWRRFFFFWNKDYLHWKEASWKIGDGTCGHLVCHSKFSRSIREKMTQVIAEYENRKDVMSQEFFCIKGSEEKSNWSRDNSWSKEFFVLDPLIKSTKTYQDYLFSLEPEIAKIIKDKWKALHIESQISLGDYPSAKDLPSHITLEKPTEYIINKFNSQILTFEKDQKALGCIIIHKGKGGNIFIEPIPFEVEESPLVGDELFIQYGLIKFFEINEARKCHILKNGTRLSFNDKQDLRFFQEQGFQYKSITHSFLSKIKKLSEPV